jgi:hypothetical protein
MLANRWDIEWLTDLIEEIAKRHLEGLYTIKLQVPQAVEYLLSKMGELQSWAELFVSSQPNVSYPLFGFTVSDLFFSVAWSHSQSGKRGDSDNVCQQAA